MQIREQVIVERVAGKEVTLKILAHNNAKCASCSAGDGCASAGKDRLLRTQLTEDVKVGEELDVIIDGPSPLLAAFLVFVYPLALAFIVGGAVFGITKHGTTAVIAGIAGMATAYLTLRLANKHFTFSVTVDRSKEQSGI